MDIHTLLCGTTNKVKQFEIIRFFEINGGEYHITLPEKKLYVEEVGETFEEIARWKAVKYSENFAGQYIISDDSGLMIDFLSGRPGIYSSRFPYEGVSDSERNETILELLKNVSIPDRTAVFYSAIAIGFNGTALFSTTGVCKGRVIVEPKGRNGFGFDPIFTPEGETKTFAEMTVEEKLSVSHRGKSLRSILSLMNADFTSY